MASQGSDSKALRNQNSQPKLTYAYEASLYLVGLFYLALAIWSVVCIMLLKMTFQKFGVSSFGVIVVAFILVYMWYFSLAFSYRIEVLNGGSMCLKSLRRTINTHAEKIPYVNMPRLPFGFVKFRLEREMGYLFANVNDTSLKKVISVIQTANPAIRFKNT